MRKGPVIRRLTGVGRLLLTLAGALVTGEAAPAIAQNHQDGMSRPVDLYNAGRGFYLQGNFDSAAAFFAAAAGADQATLQADAFYNLGNSYVKAAERLNGIDRMKAIRSLKLAIPAYRESLDRQAGMNDAQHNLELARILLKHMVDQQKKMEQRQQKKSQPDSGDTAGAGPQEADTATGNQAGNPASPESGANPTQQGTRPAEGGARDAGDEIRDRLKEMEETKRKLIQAARQKGIDPEQERRPESGRVIGGSYKDW